MPRHISLIFPGQGSQSLGMLNPFNDELNNILDITSNILDINIVDCITNGPEEVLNKTSITQPAILITSYLYYQKFINDTGLVPDLFAGHSLGEYSALLASNSIDLSTAVSLVHKRGVFMENTKPGSMFAILNLDLISIQNICKEVEEAISADRTLGGLAKDTYVESTEIEYTGDGEQPVGYVTLTFLTNYYVQETNPDVAV